MSWLMQADGALVGQEVRENNSAALSIGVKFEDTEVIPYSAKAVLWSEQNLTEEQKAQARKNIGVDGVESSGVLYSQADASSVWEIQHNLNTYPNVTIYGTTGHVIYGEVEFVDKSAIKITFSEPVAGFVRLT